MSMKAERVQRVCAASSMRRRKMARSSKSVPAIFVNGPQSVAPYPLLKIDEAKRLRALEDENRRLKRVVADQALNIQVLKDLLGKP